MTDTIHRSVDVEGLESTPTPSPTPGGHRPRRGRWIVGVAAVAAIGAGATVAVLALRDDDPNPTPAAAATTGALVAEQRQAIPPAMQEAADERQVLAEAAERAQIAEWARTNGLTGLSPASLGL